MREILYLQAGNISNHIGAHFWNTQETYFTYDDKETDDDIDVVNHDVSFREGISRKGESTYCPRLLLFDRKENFGTLGKYNDLYPDTYDDGLGSTWTGIIAEHRQAAVPKSEYLKKVDEGEDEETQDESEPPSLKPKYWSDFNRMYYVPRSVHPIPSLANLGLEEKRNPWTTGRETFQRYDMDNSVMEQDMRAFLEECDNLQGFQVTFDNQSFGGFTSSLLENIRDELPKHPMLVFPILSGIDPLSSDLDEDFAMRKTVLQDSLCLQMLQEHGTQIVPIQDPTTWTSGDWSKGLSHSPSSLYEASAILSAHIETATLPLRYKQRPEDLADYCSHLNWSQSTKFSQLSGVLPYIGATGSYTDTVTKNFSSIGTIHAKQRSNIRTFAQKHISRGLLSILSSEESERFDENLAKSSGLSRPYLSSTHAPAYPLPSSFPRHLFRRSDSSGDLDGSVKTARGSPAICMTSAVSTSSSGVADLLKAHAQFAERCAKMHLDSGVESDEIRELGSELWTIYDGYGGEEVGTDDELGEDEES